MHYAIIYRHLRSVPEYRGVEQLVARRAHNPEVVGSSPASATIKNHRFHHENGGFSNFSAKNKANKNGVGVSFGVSCRNVKNTK